MSFKTWLQRAKIPTWLLGNKDAMEAIKKAYEAGQRSGRKDEREECAKVCDSRANICAAKAEITADLDDKVELKANAWHFSVLAAAIRKRTTSENY